jgi:phospholipid/cholesterol/gamma-HCH transport system substrate-binding protein
MAASSRFRNLSVTKIGAIAAALCLLAGTLLFFKTQITVALRDGDTVTVDFSRDYKVRPNVTRVKVAGVPIGLVTGIEPHGDGSRMTLKVNEGIIETLGSEPSAAIRPTTILGGNYYVELMPGGDRGQALSETIPVDRTTVPVELDATIGMLTGPARRSISKDVELLDTTFSGPATPALRDFARSSPPNLRSSAELLQSLAGTQPDSDLTKAITGLESIAKQLTTDREALTDDLQGAATFSGTLARQSSAISSTVAQAPETLRRTQSGLDDLSGILDEVTATSETALPSVRALTDLLRSSPDDLKTLRPVVSDLQPLMRDLDPTIQQAVPAASNLQELVNDVRSPVIDRFNGPILRTLNSPTGGKGSPLGYQQVAYMFTTLNLNSMTTDSNGAMINFQPGVGPDTFTEFGSPARFMRSWREAVASTAGAAR